MVAVVVAALLAQPERHRRSRSPIAASTNRPAAALEVPEAAEAVVAKQLPAQTERRAVTATVAQAVPVESARSATAAPVGLAAREPKAPNASWTSPAYRWETTRLTSW